MAFRFFVAVVLLWSPSWAAHAKRPCRGTVPPKAWYTDAVFYEVFVRSFQDSNGDGIGDLPGLISRLDYLNDGDPATNSDLGVTALWLMPLCKSPSYHGYDVTDYRAIDPDYGTLADFDRLIAEAKKRGIRIVMDLVMNHTSRQHPWFVSGKRGPKQATFDYYVFSPKAKTWGQPWNHAAQTWHPVGPRFFYGLFWEGMPDLNYKNPAVAREMRDVAAFWAKRGVAGFRLDAARYLVENGPGAGQVDQPETHVFWKSLRASLRQGGRDPLMVGEVWTDFAITRTYFGAGDEFQMLFGFDRASAIRKSLTSGDAAPTRDALCEELNGVPAGGVMGSFLTNHDQVRLATDIDALDALKLSATLLMTLPGTPFVYYGEELGLANGRAHNDVAKRLPMRWTTARGAGFSSSDNRWAADDAPSTKPVSVQQRQPHSLWAHYRDMIRLRAAHVAARRGDAQVLDGRSEGGSILAVVRSADHERLVIVANLSAKPAARIQFNLPFALSAQRPIRAILGTIDVLRVQRNGAVTLGGLPAYGSCVFAL